MRSACLQSLAVVHKSLDSVCCFCTCELVALCLSALYDRHSKLLLAEISVYVEHSLCLLDSLLRCLVDSMTLLPQELS